MAAHCFSVGQLTNYSDPVGELLGLLRDRRRRLVIYYLRNRSDAEPVRVDALASTIAAMEVAGEQPWQDVRSTGSTLKPLEPNGEYGQNWTERVLVSLVHTHLPKLHETGIVEYDSAAETVRAAHPPAEFWERLRSFQQFNAQLAATEVN